MHTESTVRCILTLIGGAAVACALFVGNVVAALVDGPEAAVHRSAPVSVADLDLSSPEGIQAARARVHATARRLCLQLAGPRDRSRHENYLACVDATVAAALRHTTPATLAKDAGPGTAPTHQ